jgi:hypothetical protein
MIVNINLEDIEWGNGEWLITEMSVIACVEIIIDDVKTRFGTIKEPVIYDIAFEATFGIGSVEADQALCTYFLRKYQSDDAFQKRINDLAMAEFNEIMGEQMIEAAEGWE